MKYSEKQIRKAYLKWSKEERLNPTTFMKDDEIVKIDIEEISNDRANYLIKLMSK